MENRGFFPIAIVIASETVALKITVIAATLLLLVSRQYQNNSMIGIDYLTLK